jgi:hypothetical protein
MTVSDLSPTDKERLITALERGYKVIFVAVLGPDEITRAIEVEFTAVSVGEVDHVNRTVEVSAVDSDGLYQ